MKENCFICNGKNPPMTFEWNKLPSKLDHNSQISPHFTTFIIILLKYLIIVDNEFQMQIKNLKQCTNAQCNFFLYFCFLCRFQIHLFSLLFIYSLKEKKFSQKKITKATRETTQRKNVNWNNEKHL